MKNRVFEDKVVRAHRWEEKQAQERHDKWRSPGFWNNNPDLLKKVLAYQQEHNPRDTWTFMASLANKDGAHLTARELDFGMRSETFTYAKKHRQQVALAKEVQSLQGKNPQELKTIVEEKTKTLSFDQKAAAIALYRHMVRESVSWKGDLASVLLYQFSGKHPVVAKHLNEQDAVQAKKQEMYTSFRSLFSDSEMFHEVWEDAQEMDYFLDTTGNFKVARVDYTAFSPAKKGLHLDGKLFHATGVDATYPYTVAEGKTNLMHEYRSGAFADQEVITPYHGDAKLSDAHMGVYRTDADDTPRPLEKEKMDYLDDKVHTIVSEIKDIKQDIAELFSMTAAHGKGFKEKLYCENGLTFVSLDENYANSAALDIDDMVAYYDNL